ncbi:hypothetical protein [Catenulispora pinisilvae]|uniref:hypothetical protein n=1 Tax=Catenulispora pinisilvae TaxID=2705253 RepID=UPI001E2E1434|nr:hypothetical protein [Catenulispora pinisilvae]
MTGGPDPLAKPQNEAVRYGLTDLLGDLEHATDCEIYRGPGERQVIAATLWTATGQDALVAGNRWNGNGKWLLRELRSHDPEFAERWLAARNDPVAVQDCARDVLDRLGGPLFDGYLAVAPRPAVTKPA